MTRVKILALLVGVVLLFTLSTTVSAQNVRPHVFVGTAWIDDVAAPVGTTVSAWVGGAEAGSTTTTDDGGTYVILVGAGEVSLAGQTITFLIGDLSATQSATWEEGGGDELTLSASSAADEDPEVVVGEATTIATAWAGLSQFLVDGQGLTVYLFTSDTQGSDSSTCDEECLAIWPAVLTGDDAVAGGSADGSLLGSFERADDLGTQVTYNGWPLYYFAEDSAAGDVGGQGSFGVWWVLDISGDGITGIGPPGEAGSNGTNGSDGSDGSDGEDGADGVGSPGDPGSRGADGSPGSPGSPGADGSPGRAGADGDDGSSVLGIIALILAIIAIVGAGGAFLLGRRS